MSEWVYSSTNTINLWMNMLYFKTLQHQIKRSAKRHALVKIFQAAKQIFVFLLFLFFYFSKVNFIKLHWTCCISLTHNRQSKEAAKTALSKGRRGNCSKFSFELQVGIIISLNDFEQVQHRTQLCFNNKHNFG